MFGRQSRRSRMRGRSSFIIIVAAIAAGIFCFLFFTGRLPAMTVGPGALHSLGKILPHDVQAGNNMLLYSEGSELNCFQLSGQRKWSVELSTMDEISTSVSADLILNYSGPNLQVMQFTEEQLFTTSVDSPILSGAAGVEYVAVLIDAPEDDAAAQQMIYLFDKNGQKTGQLSFNRQIVQFGFFSDETITDMFWTLSVDTSGAAPMSYITMYNKSSGDMTYSITVSDRIIEKVYVTSNIIYACGSGTLTAYTYFGDVQVTERIHGWKPASVITADSSLYAAFVPRAEAAYIEGVLTFRADGTSGTVSMGSARFTLPMNVIQVAVTRQSVFAFTRDTMYVYSLGGSPDRQQPLGVEVTRAKQVSDDYVVLWGQNDSYILQLQ